MPTDSDWTTLMNFAGKESVAGGKLKEAGESHWNSPNVGATNEYKFTALPGGFYNSNAYLSKGMSTFFWSANEAANPEFASYFFMFSAGAEMIHYPQGDKKFGYSVRCIKK